MTLLKQKFRSFGLSAKFKKAMLAWSIWVTLSLVTLVIIMKNRVDKCKYGQLCRKKFFSILTIVQMFDKRLSPYAQGQYRVMDYGHPIKPIFIGIQNFWALDRQIGQIQRHLG